MTPQIVYGQRRSVYSTCSRKVRVKSTNCLTCRNNSQLIIGMYRFRSFNQLMYVCEECFRYKGLIVTNVF
jgi:hypothetical protein